MSNKGRSSHRSDSDQVSSMSKVPPSKEDILQTLDKFGFDDDDSSGKVSNGLNNNNKLRGSMDSCNSDDWEKPEVGMEAEPVSASCSNSYSSEWEKLFLKKNYRKALRNYAISGHLRSSRFRSVCWKIFLDMLTDDVEQWLAKTREWRRQYEELKDILIVNPRKAEDRTTDLTVNNPLSQADESPWNQFFVDNELRLTIKQDVIRTYPRIAFFQSNSVRNIMVDILFIYAKLYTEISYKQGMHELLAPLIFVLHCDHQAFQHASEVELLNGITENHRDIIKEMMDPQYLEHDAYGMLCQIMATVEPWYLSKDAPQPAGKEKVNTIPFSRPQDFQTSNAIVTKLTRVQNYILKKFDQELFGHLDRLDIAPQIYGIRWVRLLFGREFPMQDLLVLWDAIFSDGIGFELVDYLFVAMLLYIRDLLLASDYPQCLNCLMRYPPVGDVHYLIEKAHYLREPNHYPRPPNYTYQTVNFVRKEVSKPKENKLVNATNKAKTVMGTSWSEFSKRVRPKTLGIAGGQQPMYKSSSVPFNLQTDISPGTPRYEQQKRGSSASLSQVEDTVFGQVRSAASMARLETKNHRSMDNSPAGFTPDEGMYSSSVSNLATLPKSKAKGKKASKQEQEYEHLIAVLQGQLNEKESMCLYTASKLDIHITRLQTELLQQSLEHEDEVLLALAGIKQVRDVLKGTLKFSQMEDEEIKIKDNYYVEEESSTSPESDQSEAQAKLRGQSDASQESSSDKKKGQLFYMSSEDNSETAESPTDGAHQTTSSRTVNKDMELNDYKAGRTGSFVSTGSFGKEKDSLTQKAKDVTKKSHPLDYSPNPLYHRDSSEDET